MHYAPKDRIETSFYDEWQHNNKKRKKEKKNNNEQGKRQE